MNYKKIILYPSQDTVIFLLPQNEALHFNHPSVAR